MDDHRLPKRIMLVGLEKPGRRRRRRGGGEKEWMDSASGVGGAIIESRCTRTSWKLV